MKANQNYSVFSGVLGKQFFDEALGNFKETEETRTKGLATNMSDRDVAASLAMMARIELAQRNNAAPAESFRLSEIFMKKDSKKEYDSWEDFVYCRA